MTLLAVNNWALVFSHFHVASSSVTESTEPRDPRPPSVKYRVGQVIKHKLWGYRGIIIGWDEVAKVGIHFNH